MQGWMEPDTGHNFAHHATITDDVLGEAVWTCSKRGFWVRPIDRSRFKSALADVAPWAVVCQRCKAKAR